MPDESIRLWCEAFRAAYARRLASGGAVGDTWYLDAFGAETTPNVAVTTLT